MKPKTRKTDEGLLRLIRELKKTSNKENVNIWKAVAQNLEKPTRKRANVNLYKIDKYAKDNEYIIVPGKVLGVGEISKNINIAAYKFSDSAKSKVKNKMSIQELLRKNPKGNKTRIII
ncbi:50S ribosomal protein L18e [Candidatus Woesearchaeota archaeon]|nr:50S ribosomal protein L18e [Candidatus Woesearchaeota archaeon]